MIKCRGIAKCLVLRQHAQVARLKNGCLTLRVKIGSDKITSYPFCLSGLFPKRTIAWQPPKWDGPGPTIPLSFYSVLFSVFSAPASACLFRSTCLCQNSNASGPVLRIHIFSVDSCNSTSNSLIRAVNSSTLRTWSLNSTTRCACASSCSPGRSPPR